MMKSLNMCHKKAGNLRGTEAKLAALQDEEGRALIDVTNVLKQTLNWCRNLIKP